MAHLFGRKREGPARTKRVRLGDGEAESRADADERRRVKERDLPKHLLSEDEESKEVGDDESSGKDVDRNDSSSAEDKEEESLASRDYVLFEALNLLKGLNILKKAGT